VGREDLKKADAGAAQPAIFIASAASLISPCLSIYMSAWIAPLARGRLAT